MIKGELAVVTRRVEHQQRLERIRRKLLIAGLTRHGRGLP